MTTQPLIVSRPEGSGRDRRPARPCPTAAPRRRESRRTHRARRCKAWPGNSGAGPCRACRGPRNCAPRCARSITSVGRRVREAVERVDSPALLRHEDLPVGGELDHGGIDEPGLRQDDVLEAGGAGRERPAHRRHRVAGHVPGAADGDREGLTSGQLQRRVQGRGPARGVVGHRRAPGAGSPSSSAA